MNQQESNEGHDINNEQPQMEQQRKIDDKGNLSELYGIAVGDDSLLIHGSVESTNLTDKNDIKH